MKLPRIETQQAKKNYFKIINVNNIVVFNNYTNNQRPRHDRRKEFILTDEKITQQHADHLKFYDALGQNKFTMGNFRKASKLTLLLGKLCTTYKGIDFEHKKKSEYNERKSGYNEIRFNISCAFHEIGCNSYILFDISGKKDRRHQALIKKFVAKIQQNKDNHLVQEFYGMLKVNNISAYIVTGVSNNNHNHIYLGSKYCSERSLYIEIEKIYQRTKQDIKVSVANFYIRCSKKGRYWAVETFYPQGSCRECEHDGKIKGYYRAKKSKIVNGKIECENREALNDPGNISDKPLSPRRVIPIFSVSSDVQNVLSSNSKPETKEVSNISVVDQKNDPVKVGFNIAIGQLTQSITRLFTFIKKDSVVASRKPEPSTNMESALGFLSESMKKLKYT
jgi:hypothetical protein